MDLVIFASASIGFASEKPTGFIPHLNAKRVSQQGCEKD